MGQQEMRGNNRFFFPLLDPRAILGSRGVRSDPRLLEVSDQGSQDLLSTLHVTGQGQRSRLGLGPLRSELRSSEPYWGPPAIGRDSSNLVFESGPG